MPGGGVGSCSIARTHSLYPKQSPSSASLILSTQILKATRTVSLQKGLWTWVCQHTVPQVLSKCGPIMARLGFLIVNPISTAYPSTTPSPAETRSCLTPNPPGSTPSLIENANLVGTPGPAVYPIRGNVLALTMGGNVSIGSVGYTSLDF
jgi:hypothetical protein